MIRDVKVNKDGVVEIQGDKEFQVRVKIILRTTIEKAEARGKASVINNIIEKLSK